MFAYNKHMYCWRCVLIRVSGYLEEGQCCGLAKELEALFLERLDQLCDLPCWVHSIRLEPAIQCKVQFKLVQQVPRE